MLFSLEALKAEHGDCLLLHWGSRAAPRRLLIDGGPPGVYHETLRPRLMQLRRRGPVGQSGRLALDAVAVSHAHPDTSSASSSCFANCAATANGVATRDSVSKGCGTTPGQTSSTRIPRPRTSPRSRARHRRSSWRS